jgi:hypothetical protein
LVFILGVEKEFVLGLYPLDRVKNYDNDEEFAESVVNGGKTEVNKLEST